MTKFDSVVAVEDGPVTRIYHKGELLLSNEDGGNIYWKDVLDRLGYWVRTEYTDNVSDVALTEDETVPEAETDEISEDALAFLRHVIFGVNNT